MPQDAARDNPRPARGRRLLAWIVLGGAWALTIAAVVRSEILRHRESADVRALVDSARLARTHASATYAIRIGTAPVGRLQSTVSGGQHEEQLAYVIDGDLVLFQPMRLKGVVLAGWDRRPQRLVLEAHVGTEHHRLDGTLRPDPASGGSLFELRYTPPASSGMAARDFDWVLPEAPILAPGPLPIPELGALAGAPPDPSAGDTFSASATREGAVPDPVTGAPLQWSLASTRLETLVVAGVAREARRHDLRVGQWEAHAWTESSGFPLKLELPGGVIVELVEETR